MLAQEKLLDRTIVRPGESTFFETLLVKPETILIPFKYLDAVVAPVAKDEQGGLIRIAVKPKINDGGQTINTLAHIRRAANQVYLFAAALEHKNSPLAVMTMGRV